MQTGQLILLDCGYYFLKNKVIAVFYTYHDVNFIGPHSLRAAADLTAIPALLLLHGLGNLKCTDEFSLLIYPSMLHVVQAINNFINWKYKPMSYYRKATSYATIPQNQAQLGKNTKIQ